MLVSNDGVHGPVDELLGHRVGEKEGDEPAGKTVGLDTFEEAEIEGRRIVDWVHHPHHVHQLAPRTWGKIYRPS